MINIIWKGVQIMGQIANQIAFEIFYKVKSTVYKGLHRVGI